MQHEKFAYPTLDALRDRAKALEAWLPLSEDMAPLFRPLVVQDRVIANRIAFQPMEGSDGTLDGRPGPLTVRRYERFAKGGPGLIWFEAVAVAPEARASAHQLWMTEDNVDDYKRLVEHIKTLCMQENGFEPVVILQATHSGRYSKPEGKPAPLIAYNNPLFEKDNPIDASRILSDDQLAAYEARFSVTAKLAEQAGFDGVDVKCCHRYLANELLSAYTRPGLYGGSLENRSRFLRNAYAAARSAVSPRMIVTSRMNAYDGFPYPYGFGVREDEGTAVDLTETKAVIRMLRFQGLPLLNITIGNPYVNPHVNRPYDKGNYVPDEHPLTGEARMMRCVAELQQDQPDLPIIGSAFSYLRQHSPALAAGMVGGGHAAMAGFGRMAFAYPEFPRILREGGSLDPRKVCLTCGQCALRLRAGVPSGCVLHDNQTYPAV